MEAGRDRYPWEANRREKGDPTTGGVHSRWGEKLGQEGTLRGLWDGRGMWPTFLLSTWAPESLLGPKPGPPPSDAPSNAPFRSWERGREEEERKGRGKWDNREGPLGTGGSKGNTASVCPIHLGPNKPAAVLVLILHTWRCEAAPCPRPLGPFPDPWVLNLGPAPTKHEPHLIHTHT